MKRNILHALYGLIIIGAFASCSRPVAYFQPTTREHFKAATTETVAAVSADQPTEAVSVVSESVNPVATPTEQLAQTKQAVGQLEAYVRNDNKLASNKKLANRMERLNEALETASTKATPTANTATSAKKMTFAERMVLKKMNKKISKQLAPANPEKTMVSSGTLATGAVLVIVGLLLLLLTTGTAATIGLIVLLVGAIVLLVGLL